MSKIAFSLTFWRNISPLSFPYSFSAPSPNCSSLFHFFSGGEESYEPFRDSLRMKCGSGRPSFILVSLTVVVSWRGMTETGTFDEITRKKKHLYDGSGKTRLEPLRPFLQISGLPLTSELLRIMQLI